MASQPFPTPTPPPTIQTIAKMAATIYCILQTTTLLATIPLHIHHRNFVDDIFYPYNQNLLPITTLQQQKSQHTDIQSTGHNTEYLDRFS